MDEILKRDQNHITVLGGITNDSDQDIMMLRVDPITKRLLVSATGVGISIGETVTGGTPNEILFVDASGNLAQSASLKWTDATKVLQVGDVPNGGFYGTPTTYVASVGKNETNVITNPSYYTHFIVSPTLTQTVNTSSGANAIYADITLTGSATSPGFIQGGYFGAAYTGSGTVSGVYGNQMVAALGPTSTSNQGVWGMLISNDVQGTVTNGVYGIAIYNSMDGGTADKQFGLFVGTQEGATDNWNIYSGSLTTDFDSSLTEYWTASPNFFGTINNDSDTKYVALSAITQSNDTATASIGIYGAGVTKQTAGHNMDLVIGFEGDALIYGGGTTTKGVGVWAFASHSGTGTATTLSAVFADTVRKSSSGALTNGIGVEIADQTQATNNWALKSGLGLVEFDDRLFVFQQTLGNRVMTLSSIASNDDPTEDVYQNKVLTTTATQTTLHTFTIPASTTYSIEATVVARRTGGSSGTAEDGARYKITAAYKNVGGTATLIGAVTVISSAEDQGAWDATFDVTGATARVRVTGAANNNISWVMTARTYAVSS